MKKIKKFKVNLRVREIMRVIKKLTNSAELTPEIEEAVQRGCHFYSKALIPAVVCETFAKGFLPFIYEKDAPAKWVAQSVFFVTIGSELEREYKKNEEAFGQHTSKIVSAVAVDALDQAKNFIARLIAQEAQDESCELSRAADIEPDFYEAAFNAVCAGKIDITLQDGKLIPQYSSCGLFYWTPSKKKNKK
ncbi:MAG: hypothetical protein LBQ47_00180 [Endomicrobium sp.]|jgi:hypothetical protein|nr:hypothetical protein [Endomicrobium sp.]